MLRDIPRIYMMMFGFVAIIVIIMFWYSSMFHRGGDTTALNESILSSAVSEVDQASRIYEGVLLLANTFEPTVWTDIESNYPEGSLVQFDYMFDVTDTRFGAIENETVSSPSYKIGSSVATDVPRADHVTYMIGRPIESVRVKIREAGETAGEWTYVSTVTVDSASRD